MESEELYIKLEEKKTIKKPHYGGHRSRLRKRFLENGRRALADYELLEMVLYGAIPRSDVKPLAKNLIAEFGSFAGVVQAEAAQLQKIAGVGEAVLASIKLLEAAAELMLLQKASDAPILQTWDALLNYCKIAMAERAQEEFHILFLNNKNRLMLDEMQNRGTVDRTPAYPREVVKRALEIGASSIIIVHNHPSGDPTPSKEDVVLTKAIALAANAMNIRLHDHLIVSRSGHFSFKSNELL